MFGYTIYSYYLLKIIYNVLNISVYIPKITFLIYQNLESELLYLIVSFL